MTTWYAQTAGGNWSSGVMWNDQAGGGGSFGTPGNGDTCDLNGKTVVMDIATIPASGTLAAIISPATTGGITLAMSGSTTYVINATQITAGTKTTGILNITGSAPSATLTINGSVTGGSTSAAYGGTYLNTGTATINGNVTGTSAVGFHNSSTGTLIVNGNAVGGAGGIGVYKLGTGTTTINGNVTGGSSSLGYGAANATTGTLAIVGNVVGGSGGNAYGANNASTGILTVTGNVTGATVIGILNTTTGTVTITGNVTGGSGSGGISSGVHNASTGIVTINGSVTGGSHITAYGLHNPGGGTCTVNSGNLIHSTTTIPCSAKIFYNPASGNYTQYALTGGSTFKQYREDAFVTAAQVQSGVTFWANGVSGTGTYTPGGYPSTNDVRFGVVFGASSEYTGTVSIPAVGNVLQGVGFGYGGGTEFTGTYVVTAAADVQSGVAFGAAGAQTGTFAAPAQSDVRQGVGYGAASTEYTGSLGGGVVTLTAA